MPHKDLPLPDFEHLPLGDVQSRIRSLDAGALDVLAEYELQHGARTPVLQALADRREQLNAGARPSPGDAAAVDPQRPAPPATGSPVTPATSGPPVNPPSQGVPTNPAQPRT